jgi:parallel beta-helix repeat protein
MNGTYTKANSFDNIVTIKRSGTENAWITYQAYPGHTPKLESRNWHGISIQGASYIIIDGFEIEGNNNNITLEKAIAKQSDLNNPFTSGNGIGIDASLGKNSVHSHHIIVRNNKIYNCGGGGIYTIHADYVTIENNRIYKNAWYAPYGCSGVSNYQNWNSDNTTGYKMIIRNNIVYGNQNLIPFYVEQKITDGNGIIIDDSRNTQGGSKLGAYQGRTLIENNITYHNGGRGIHIYKSEFIDIINNTTYQNSQHPAIKDGEISAIYANDVRVFNNIMNARIGLPANYVYSSTHVMYDYNLIYNARSLISTGTHNLLGQDPLFVDPSTENFALQMGSPAINTGTPTLTAAKDILGVHRSTSVGIDMGAFEDITSNQISAPVPIAPTPPSTSWADILNGTRLADILTGKEGNDWIYGDRANDTLIGNSGNDNLLGGEDHDLLLGGKGSDILLGEAGNDQLSGGAGSNKLTGGAGFDIFTLRQGKGRDIVQDFQNHRDRLNLPNSLGFNHLTFAQVGANTVIQADHDLVAVLTGIRVSQMNSADFI